MAVDEERGFARRAEPFGRHDGMPQCGNDPHAGHRKGVQAILEPLRRLKDILPVGRKGGDAGNGRKGFQFIQMRVALGAGAFESGA